MTSAREARSRASSSTRWRGTSRPCTGTPCSSPTVCAAASGRYCPTRPACPRRATSCRSGHGQPGDDLEVTHQGDLLYIDQSVDAIRRIRYTPPNNAPAAVATANLTSGNAPLAVTFSGLGSTDAEGDALTYAWDLDGDDLLDDSTAAQPTFTYSTPGTRTVTLKVTDPEGAFSTTTVASRSMRPPRRWRRPTHLRQRAACGHLQRVGSTDTDGGALTYAWDLDADTVFDDSAAVQPIFDYTTPGTYTVTLEVTDADGASSTATVADQGERDAHRGRHGECRVRDAPLAVRSAGWGPPTPTGTPWRMPGTSTGTTSSTTPRRRNRRSPTRPLAPTP